MLQNDDDDDDDDDFVDLCEIIIIRSVKKKICIIKWWGKAKNRWSSVMVFFKMIIITCTWNEILVLETEEERNRWDKHERSVICMIELTDWKLNLRSERK